MADEYKIRFMAFKKSRAFRGAAAARYEIDQGQGPFYLWMDREDINANILEFGRLDELVKGLTAYETPGQDRTADDYR